MTLAKITKDYRKLALEYSVECFDNYTLLVSDSKGACIRRVTPTTGRFEIISKPGTTYADQDFLEKVITKIEGRRYPNILLWMGTCEITVKQGSIIKIRDPPYQNIDQCIVEAIAFKNKLERANPEAKIAFIECPYYSPIKYNALKKNKDSLVHSEDKNAENIRNKDSLVRGRTREKNNRDVYYSTKYRGRNNKKGDNNNSRNKDSLVSARSRDNTKYRDHNNNKDYNNNSGKQENLKIRVQNNTSQKRKIQTEGSGPNKRLKVTIKGGYKNITKQQPLYEDKLLSKVVDYYNLKIRQLNHYRTPKLSRDIIHSHKPSNRKICTYKKNYNLYHDGIHPSRPLAKLWRYKLFRVALELDKLNPRPKTGSKSTATNRAYRKY